MGTQYTVRNERQIRGSHKVIRNGDKQLQVIPFPKPKSNNKQKIEEPKTDIECPRCKQRN